MASTLVLDDPDAIAVATHPVRAALLVAMRTPTTAAEAGRATGQSRQNAAYHVRALADAGLLRHVGERTTGRFVEQLYEAVAPTIVISSRSTWGDDPRRAEALADQVSLGQLVEQGERLQRDAAALLDRAAFDGGEVASASVVVEVHLPDEERRAAFLHDYVEAVARLTSRYGAPEGEAYRVVLAAYPDPEEP